MLGVPLGVVAAFGPPRLSAVATMGAEWLPFKPTEYVSVYPLASLGVRWRFL